MVSVEKAMRIVIKKNPGKFIAGCTDFGSFYLFSMLPFGANAGEGYYTGCFFPAVNKRTGKYFFYDIASDVELFDKAKPVF